MKNPTNNKTNLISRHTLALSMSVKMSEHPFHALFQTFAKVSNSIQTQLSNLIAQSHKPSPTAHKRLLSASSSSSPSSSARVVASSDNGSDHHPELKDILSTEKVILVVGIRYTHWFCSVLILKDAAFIGFPCLWSVLERGISQTVW